MKGYLLAHPRFGLYLGFGGDYHHWSKVNPERLMMATVFPELSDVVDFLRQWSPALLPVEAIAIEADLQLGLALYASVGRCVEAGAEGWISQSTPCVGPLQ